MDALALVLTVAALVMFAFAASGRELRRLNEIALGLVLLTAALICQFTSLPDRGGQVVDVADGQGRAGHLPEVVHLDAGAEAGQPGDRLEKLLPGQGRDHPGNPAKPRPPHRAPWSWRWCRRG